MEKLYHITQEDLWYLAKLKGEYDFCALKTDGFIHLSFKEQVIATANRFFKDKENLIVLEIQKDLLRSELKVEKADDVAESFPHLYGPLNLESVVKVWTLSKNSEGTFEDLVD